MKKICENCSTISFNLDNFFDEDDDHDMEVHSECNHCIEETLNHDSRTR